MIQTSEIMNKKWLWRTGKLTHTKLRGWKNLDLSGIEPRASIQFCKHKICSDIMSILKSGVKLIGIVDQ